MEMQPINNYQPDTVDNNNSSLVWSASPEWLNEMGIKDLGKPQTDDNPNDGEIDPVCGGIIGLTVLGLTNYFINRAEKKRKRQTNNTSHEYGIGGHPQVKSAREEFEEGVEAVATAECERLSIPIGGAEYKSRVQSWTEQLEKGSVDYDRFDFESEGLQTHIRSGRAGSKITIIEGKLK